MKFDKPMKVSDLIETLKELPGDLEVRFAYDYGDHSHSTVAAKIFNVELGNVEFSEYHRMDTLIEEDGVCEQNECDKKEVVVLS